MEEAGADLALAAESPKLLAALYLPSAAALPGGASPAAERATLLLGLVRRWTARERELEVGAAATRRDALLSRLRANLSEVLAEGADDSWANYEELRGLRNELSLELLGHGTKGW